MIPVYASPWITRRNTGQIAGEAQGVTRHLINHLRYLRSSACAVPARRQQRGVFTASCSQVCLREAVVTLIGPDDHWVVLEKLLPASEVGSVRDWHAWTRQMLANLPEVGDWCGVLHLATPTPHVHVVYAPRWERLAPVSPLSHPQQVPALLPAGHPREEQS